MYINIYYVLINQYSVFLFKWLLVYQTVYVLNICVENGFDQLTLCKTIVFHF